MPGFSCLALCPLLAAFPLRSEVGGSDGFGPPVIAVGMRVTGHPRTDPSVRDSRTGLPPWASDGKAAPGPRMKDAGSGQPAPHADRAAVGSRTRTHGCSPSQCGPARYRGGSDPRCPGSRARRVRACQSLRPHWAGGLSRSRAPAYRRGPPPPTPCRSPDALGVFSVAGQVESGRRRRAARSPTGRRRASGRADGESSTLRRLAGKRPGTRSRWPQMCQHHLHLNLIPNAVACLVSGKTTSCIRRGPNRRGTCRSGNAGVIRECGYPQRSKMPPATD